MKHNKNIDIIKGLGICLMVLGHCRFPGSHFVYLFHMALFFIASGYCFNPRYSEKFEAVCHFVKRRLKSLWIPYVIYNSVFLLMHNWFLDMNIMTDSTAYLVQMGEFNLTGGNAYYLDFKGFLISEIKILCFGAAEPMGGASWFLRIIFSISVLFCFSDYLFRKLVKNKRELAQIILSIVLLIISYFISKTGWSYMNIPTIFSAYILFVSGVLLKKISLEQYYSTTPKCSFIIIISLIVLMLCNKIGSINIDLNQYTNPIFLLAASSAGWALAYGYSHLILKVRWLEKILLFIGRNTIPILLLHFLCFKIVTLLELKVYDFPLYMLASYPVLIQRGGWWIAYAIVGITFPLAIIVSLKHCRNILISQWKLNSRKQNRF